LFEGVIADLKQKVPAGIISRRFHNGLIEAFANLASILRDQTDLSRVCLSGGTFHNQYLTEGLESRLLSAGFEVFTHPEVPAGDGGLSLGQAVVAAAKLRNLQS
jgi:hydrogenase maturation protein HypF